MEPSIEKPAFLRNTDEIAEPSVIAAYNPLIIDGKAEIYYFVRHDFLQNFDCSTKLREVYQSLSFFIIQAAARGAARNLRGDIIRPVSLAKAHLEQWCRTLMLPRYSNMIHLPQLREGIRRMLNVDKGEN